MIGKCFEKLDQPKLALPYLQRAVELDETDVQSRLSFGITLASLELFELAEPQFLQVLEQDPNHSDAHYN